MASALAATATASPIARRVGETERPWYASRSRNAASTANAGMTARSHSRGLPPNDAKSMRKARATIGALVVRLMRLTMRKGSARSASA